jgi:hypothetical protein
MVKTEAMLLAVTAVLTLVAVVVEVLTTTATLRAVMVAQELLLLDTKLELYLSDKLCVCLI